MISKHMDLTKAGEPQFKNAVKNLAAEAGALVPDNPEISMLIFKEVLNEIDRVRYYRPKSPRPGQPRMTMKAHNKWKKERKNVLP